MRPSIYRFEFSESVPMAGVSASMAVALLAAEGLCPTALIHVGFAYALDERRHSLVADARTWVGQLVTCIFVALLLREFGESAFRTEPVTADALSPSAPEAAATSASGPMCPAMPVPGNSSPSKREIQ